ncbi:TetR/AcrR family transcriptional regulator [Microbulbifer sp. OS29]|uniref:TetR/AcrR family transcriptional regulator n=1 Tax=Microbulbifer okhotskensis TaxID=2926617 RepID=A0A9X2ENK5_9GAMM|nr:TetR/AcrR family transcriptional regulator [Microbulbifer okhotskensis]MCO1335557.1 TetR/AcrR family transcriptional regulator [Microbulbifer okhotskensis]
MSEKKPTRSELKRQSIIDAAKQAFQELGVQGTSMDELAARAQVSKRTVYNHFASKEALVMYLISDLWQQATQSPGCDYNPGSDLYAQLRALLELEIKTICNPQYIDLNRMAFDYFFHQPDALRKEMEKFKAHETGVQRWIKSAVADGRLTQLDVEVASGQIHNLIKGGCFWPQLLQLSGPPTQAEQVALAERTTAMFLSYYQA